LLTLAAGSGLYVSVILSPSRAVSDPDRATTLLTLAAGVALAEGVERATGLSPAIKWPNDLLVARRKLAGILAEALSDVVVLGYGINVGPMAYPPELRDRATSLETELGRPIDRAVVAVETPLRWRRADDPSAAVSAHARRVAAPSPIYQRVAGIRPPGRNPASLMVLTRSGPCWSSRPIGSSGRAGEALDPTGSASPSTSAIPTSCWREPTAG
jgi:hypothetical protein